MLFQYRIFWYQYYIVFRSRLTSFMIKLDSTVVRQKYIHKEHHTLKCQYFQLRRSAIHEVAADWLFWGGLGAHLETE